MKVGFCIPYRKDDATAMCLQVGKLALDFGLDVEIYPRERPVQVHPLWDRFLVRNRRGKFAEWAGGLDYLIYTTVPQARDVTMARQAKVKVILLVMWDELETNDLETIRLFDHVVCPGRAVYKHLEYCAGAANLYAIPWDSGIPITFDPRRMDGERIGVIWPIDGQQFNRQDPKFVKVAEMLLELCPKAWLTVVYSNNVTSNFLKDLRRMTVYGNGRVELMRNTPTEKQELLFGRHEITLWPTLVESAALVGLTSLSMGTPVIAFDYPVVGDVIKDGRNGMLVPCEIETSEIGIPRVKPDFPLFGRRLVDLVNTPAQIDALRQNSVTGLRERREMFVSRWKDLFDGYV